MRKQKLLLPAKDIVQHGCERIMIRTVNTDIVVLAIALYLPIHESELWIGFGVGDNFKYVPIHTLVGSLDPKCRALRCLQNLEMYQHWRD